jgi:uncharacterized Zn-binding protein involved in type VI secretion
VHARAAGAAGSSFCGAGSVGDDKPNGDKQPASGSGDATGVPFKPGFKRDLYKKEGPKGSREWGNRKPEPKDSNAPKKGPGKELSAGPLKTWKTASDHAYAFDSHANAQDKTFVQGLKLKTSDIEAGSASVNLNEGKGKVVLLKGSAEGSVVHAEIDLAEIVGEWLFGKAKPVPSVPAPPAVSMAPMAARMGDLTTHGSPLLPGPGSPNVFIGSMPAWRATIDLAMCPFPGAAPHGTGPTLNGEPTVFINSMPAARMGDFVVEPSGGPNVIVSGCPTVMIGSPAPPPPEPSSPHEGPQELPWVVFGASATGDMVRGEAKADASAEWDAKKVKGKVEAAAGAEIALFKAKLPLNVKLRIPNTDMYLGLGLTVEASALSVGAEAGGGAALNKDGKAFKVDGGAKVGVGLFGVGAKFSVDVGK